MNATNTNTNIRALNVQERTLAFSPNANLDHDASYALWQYAEEIAGNEAEEGIAPREAMSDIVRVDIKRMRTTLDGMVGRIHATILTSRRLRVGEEMPADVLTGPMGRAQRALDVLMGALAEASAMADVLKYEQ